MPFIINHFMPCNFNTELQRFYTDGEEQIKNMLINELTFKIITKMKKERKI